MTRYKNGTVKTDDVELSLLLLLAKIGNEAFYKELNKEVYERNRTDLIKISNAISYGLIGEILHKDI